MAKWNIGPKNGMWKGGRSVASNGYILVRVGRNHHLSDVRGYAYEHRVNAEKALGRKLKKGEQVHHKKKHQTKNNKATNLKVCRSIAWHRFEHRKPGSSLRIPGQRNPIVKCKCGCGLKFNRFDSSGRPRFYVSGHNPQKVAVRDLFLNALNQESKRLELIAKETGQSLQAVKVMASKLVQTNHIIRISRGIYGRQN